MMSRDLVLRAARLAFERAVELARHVLSVRPAARVAHVVLAGAASSPLSFAPR